jgi:ergothioneine biosynthesis protein EgtC
MCRWLTYCGEPIYLDKVLFEPQYSLINQSLHARHSHVTTNGDGFGVGWYGDRGVPGVYRDILPAWNDHNLKSLSHQIRSGLFLAHVRASTGTATARSNCHPFSHGKWLFMHNGQIGGYDRLRRKLEGVIDDDYYQYRLGTTDSEMLFYMMFSEGLEQRPMDALTRTVARVNRDRDALGIETPFRLTATLTDGARIYAVRYSTDDAPPSLYWSRMDGHLLVVSEPFDEDDARTWNEVPPNQILVAERDGAVDMVPFIPG